MQSASRENTFGFIKQGPKVRKIHDMGKGGGEMVREKRNIGFKEKREKKKRENLKIFDSQEGNKRVLVRKFESGI
jgi:hypothetical protein